MTVSPITLYGNELSGHTHRVTLLLTMLELPYQFVPVSAEVRASADFLNPLGQIPVLQDGPLVLADSNAIMVYLVRRYAPGSSWLPNDPVGEYNVQRWLSIAAGELKHGPAALRIMAVFGRPGDKNGAIQIAGKLLRFMETHLATRAFLAAEHPTIADLACYAYIAHAPEGGISLDPYPAICAWLSRVAALPRFTPMLSSPTPKQETA